jgi:hypothetical protein
VREWLRRHRWEVTAAALVTFLGLVLRLNQLDQAPAFLDNWDELQFAWAGLNLLQHGDAYTWSYFPAYPSVTALSAYGTTFPMVHHWMDHPPGFSLLIGGFLWLLGDRDMLALSPEHVRLLPVAFSTSTIPLAYLLVRRAVGWWPGFWAALLVATGPAAVLMGREAEPESVMSPLLMVALLLAEPPGGRWRPLTLAAICLLEPLFKVTGVAVAGIVGVNLVMLGRWRLAAACVAAAAVGLGIYVLYGWAVDWPVFARAVGLQAHNRTGMLAAYEFLTASSGINRPLHDGWWVLGWIGVGALLFWGGRTRPNRLLAWPAVGYAVAILVLAGQVQTAQYGWYRVMILPVVYAAAGVLAWRALAAPSPARLAAIAMLGGAAATNWWLGPAGGEWVPNPVLLVAALALLILPAAVLSLPGFVRQARWSRLAAGAALLAMVLGNVSESLRLASIFVRF